MVWDEELSVPLGPNALLNRIASRIGDPILGEVRGSEFFLRMRQDGVNPWAPVLRGRVDSGAPGSVVRIRFEKPRLVSHELVGLLFFPLWLAMFIEGVVISSSEPLLLKIGGVAIPFIMVGIWIFIRRRFHLQHPAQIEQLRRFIGETVSGRQ